MDISFLQIKIQTESFGSNLDLMFFASGSRRVDGIRV
jgi:hypothetical protein